MAALEIHAAYANCDVDVHSSFGEAKANFYAFAHTGQFNYATFDIDPGKVPVTTVQPEYFMLRPMKQWHDYFAWHNIRLSDLPVTMNAVQQQLFRNLATTVQPRYDFGIYIICEITNFFRTAYSSNHRYTFLHNQLYQSTAATIKNFPLDANMFIANTFSQNQYPWSRLASTRLPVDTQASLYSRYHASMHRKMGASV